MAPDRPAVAFEGIRHRIGQRLPAVAEAAEGRAGDGPDRTRRQVWPRHRGCERPSCAGQVALPELSSSWTVAQAKLLTQCWLPDKDQTQKTLVPTGAQHRVVASDCSQRPCPDREEGCCKASYYNVPSWRLSLSRVSWGEEPWRWKTAREKTLPKTKAKTRDMRRRRMRWRPSAAETAPRIRDGTLLARTRASR